MASEKDYIVALGRTVQRLFEAGVTDPSAQEIVEAYYGDDKIVSAAMVEDARKKLGRIRDFMEQNYSEIPICLVSETYYVRYRDTPPESPEEARRCLPVGQGVKASGIRAISGEGDLIWQQAIALNFASGAGKVKKSGDRTIRAVQGHKLSDEEAARLLVEPQERYQLEAPGVAADLIKALPSGDQEEL